MESDVRELRGILQESSSHNDNSQLFNNIYNNDNSQTQYTSHIYKAQSHTSTQIQYQPPTSTQAHYQSEQTSNQYTSSQTPINVETNMCTLPYSTTPFTKPITTYNSTITSNQNNVLDNNINTRDKFQVYFPNTGEPVQTTANCNIERTGNETENR